MSIDLSSSVNLIKGDRVNLSKEVPNLTKLRIGLGWDTNNTDSGSAFDLDASVFMLGSNSKTPSSSNFIFFNNLESKDGSVIHQGDNLTGKGDGDDEVIMVNLSKMSSNITSLMFVVTIYDYEKRKQNFGQINNSFIRIIDDTTNKEIARYNLEEDFSAETSIEFGSLYLHNNQWKFRAIGTGYKTGLSAFTDKYM